jgi:dimethylglycine dehydrogenase
MGSYYLQRWHMRWFRDHLPPSGVALSNISDEITGFALAGPRSREVLAALTSADLSSKALPFMACRKMEVGLLNAHIGRLSVAGELGYEINVPASEQLTLHQMLMEAGHDHGLAEIGYNALNSLRMEKSFGIWSREFTWAYTPGMSGLDRLVAFDKADFIGRDAALKERDKPSQRKLVTLEIAAEDADASDFEPVWIGERRIGFVTSGAYGHSAGKSLAMAYLDRDVSAAGTAVEVHVIGLRRRATVLPGPVHDPAGARMRG